MEEGILAMTGPVWESGMDNLEDYLLDDGTVVAFKVVSRRLGPPIYGRFFKKDEGLTGFAFAFSGEIQVQYSRKIGGCFPAVWFVCFRWPTQRVVCEGLSFEDTLQKAIKSVRSGIRSIENKLLEIEAEGGYIPNE